MKTKIYAANRIIIYMLFWLAVSGCSTTEPDNFKTLSKMMDNCFGQYLNGDINQARLSMFSFLKITDNIKSPGRQAYYRLFAYARLFTIETEAANPGQAERAFIKATYWSLCEDELAHVNDEETLNNVRSLDREKLTQSVEKWDKEHNHGGLAKYMDKQ